MNQQIDSDIVIFEVYPTDRFNDDMKFYIKKKKFKHIADDIEDILEGLEEGVFSGTPIDDLNFPNGKTVYKVRAVNTDAKKGKADGYRLLYYVKEDDKIVYLLTIYFKKDDNRIPTDSEIRELIKKHCN